MHEHSSAAPLTGVAFVALVVAAFMIGGETPAADTPPAQLADFYAREEDRHHFAALILTIAVVLFVFFLGTLRALLRSAGDADRLSAIAFGGGLVAAVGLLSWSGFTFSIVFAGDAAPEAIQAVHMLTAGFNSVVVGGLSALLIASGIVGARAQVLPKWLAWTATALGVLAVTPVGHGAFLAFLAWTAIVSVLLWHRRSTAPLRTLDPAVG